MLGQLPNLLTAMRGVLGALVLYGTVKAGAAAETAPGLAQLWQQFAFLAFVAAALTDAADGALARALGAESRLGMWLDPIADKMLVGFALVAAILINPAVWVIIPAILIIARDAAVTAFRASPSGASAVAPTAAAKLKTALQMTAIGALLLAPAIWVADPGPGSLRTAFEWGALALLWAAALLSVQTGWRYWRGRSRS